MIRVLLGLVVIAGTLVDVYITTVSMRGSGPVTSSFTRHGWRLAMLVSRKNHRALEILGSLMLPAVVLLWAMLLYSGWVLVFTGHPDAVVNATTGQPIGGWERIYYTGYVISTLGNGEFRPGGATWQLLTVAAALSGLALITLSITYVTPVMDAVVQKRQVAKTIIGLGATPADVIGNGWNGQGFQPLTTHLANLTPELTGLAQQHMAYPILHYFHAVDRTTALPPAIAVLEDALTLLCHGVDGRHRLDATTLRSVTAAIGTLLDALDTAHIDPSSTSPDAPRLAILDRLGVPRVDEHDYVVGTKGLSERRALLLGFVESDGWAWPSD